MDRWFQRHSTCNQCLPTNAIIYKVMSNPSAPTGNRQLTLTVVNTTAARVPSVGVATQMIETTTTAPTAVSFVAHTGMSFGETSARVLCQKSLLRYSAKIRLMTAFPPASLYQKHS